MKDLTIEVENTLETLALLGETLGNAGVNIEGLCALQGKGKDIVHLLVADEIRAKDALSEVDIEVALISDVYVLDKNKKQVVGRPGSFGGICRHLINHGIQVNFAYAAENNKFVFGVDDLDKVQQIL